MTEETIRQAVESQGFLKLVGARLDKVGVGTCEFSVESRDELLQHHGFFHGGVIAFLLDIAMTVAASTVLGTDRAALTAEYKLNFLAPGVGERLICRASVVKAGSMLTVTEGKVFAVKGGKEKAIATALGTVANVGLERVS